MFWHNRNSDSATEGSQEHRSFKAISEARVENTPGRHHVAESRQIKQPKGAEYFETSDSDLASNRRTHLGQSHFGVIGAVKDRDATCVHDSCLGVNRRVVVPF